MKKCIPFVLLALFLAGCGSAQPTITDNGKPGQIQVTVFVDVNNNGALDTGEKGMRDMVLLSHDDTCPPQGLDFQQARTDENGEIIFSDLKPGVYCVGYSGMSSTTTKGATKVGVSSEETTQVYIGLIQ